MWPQLKQKFIESRRGARVSALLAVLVGLVLWYTPLGHGLIHYSYDLPIMMGPRNLREDLLIIKMDEQSYNELKQPYPNWGREIHAQLVDKLTAGKAKLVVFDVYFPESTTNQHDGLLAAAMKANGRVVLAADLSTMPGYVSVQISPPLETFARAANRWGISQVDLDADPAIRRHYPGTEAWPSLPWAAALAAKVDLPDSPEARLAERWMWYYGDEGSLPSISYHQALTDRPPEYFKDKYIFIGGKPKTKFIHEETDEFHTPYTHLGGPLMSGVEVEATTFLNLVHREWLTKMPAWLEILLLFGGGFLFSYVLSLVRPLTGAFVVVGGFLLTALAAMILFWSQHIWFSWLLIAGAQIPCAWACIIVWQTQNLHRRIAALAEPAATPTPAGASPVLVSRPISSGLPPIAISTPGAAPALIPPLGTDGQGDTRVVATIADHTLLRRIGKGAYGEVYLAKNAIGLYHAVKVIHRADFADADPYEREFRGIQKYMPVSRNHPSLVQLLHVGRNDAAGYFYYIMELGDDRVNGAKIDPQTYAAKNLADDLRSHGRMRVADCVRAFISLSGALSYLHTENLIHRDIKPANIIFAKGVPKFADIGLVTDIATQGHDVTYIGTEGYIAPEGPGTPGADIYSLGMVLYEAATGMDRHKFPELPDTLAERSDKYGLILLNHIYLKACEQDPQKRYQTAKEMADELEALQKKLASPEN